MNAASAAGADVGQFAQSLNDNLSSAGNDAVGAVLNAASAAGADMGQFSSSIGSAITAPVQQAASTAGQAAQSLGITGPTPNAPGDLIDQARQAATAAGIDPDIFARQINQESGFDPTAKSGAGALGIAQFMPATAAGMKIDPMNAAQALTAAAQLDASNLQKYGGDWGEALAAYNAGGGNVDKYGGIPPFAETQCIRQEHPGRGAERGAAGRQRGGWCCTGRGTDRPDRRKHGTGRGAERGSQDVAVWHGSELR